MANQLKPIEQAILFHALALLEIVLCGPYAISVRRSDITKSHFFDDCGEPSAVDVKKLRRKLLKNGEPA